MTRSFGASIIDDGQTRFRLWAPDREMVLLELDGEDPVRLSALDDGWHEAILPAGPGTPYRYHVAPDLTVPDPASRAQADDVHGWSLVVDPAAYVWRNPSWHGRPWHEAVIYELHVGAMGGFAGVIEDLPRLAELGVTAIELMPVADFPGERNWGYDGVLPYAPDRAYGTPDDLRRLVDTAHGLGLMVLLDVVYNHFGPEGNYLGGYASGFYRHDRKTPWGDALDFRRPQVQRFFIENALHWLEEYRFDGLRFDAVHAIGETDFLTEMAVEIRTEAPRGRHVHLIVENEANEAELLRPSPHAPGFDAQWADDFHHCIHTLLTSEKEAYYEDFAARPAVLLARALSEGFAFQGEPSKHAGGKPRGTPSGHLPPINFVICLQNHDQIGNRALGERLSMLAEPAGLRAATVLLLLTPQIPLIFMGDEWAATAPFQFFTSFTGDLAKAVRTGRRREFSAFAAFHDPAQRNRIPDPNDADTFERSRHDLAEASAPGHAEWVTFYRTLLRIRRDKIMPRMLGAHSLGAEPLGGTGASARWRMGDGAELCIAVNLGDEALRCDRHPGRILFATHNITDTLPGHSALVTLAEPH